MSVIIIIVFLFFLLLIIDDQSKITKSLGWIILSIILFIVGIFVFVSLTVPARVGNPSVIDFLIYSLVHFLTSLSVIQAVVIVILLLDSLLFIHQYKIDEEFRNKVKKINEIFRKSGPYIVIGIIALLFIALFFAISSGELPEEIIDSILEKYIP